MTPWRIVLGLGLVALGVLFLLGQAGYVNALEIVVRWWPLAIIVLGVFQLAASREGVAGAIVGILIGLTLLGVTLGILPGNTLAILGALALIALGAWVLLNRGGGARSGAGDQETVDSFAVFSEIEVSSSSPGFRGGFLGGLFGEVTLDLRNASLAPEGASINSTALFSDVTVRVPAGWRVEIGGVPVFSEIENEARAYGRPGPGAPFLRVLPVVLFTDVKVKL